MSRRTSHDPEPWWVMLGRGLGRGAPFLFIATTILVAGVLGFEALRNLPEVVTGGGRLTSVVLLIAGFVTVTLLLYLGTLIHRTLELGDAREALGMPEGSIRALIAMSLILIFSIIGVVVFSAAQNAGVADSRNLTQADVDALSDRDIVAITRVDPSPLPGASPGDPTPEPRYDVTLRTPMTQESHDFGLQLLSTVSTLVVAVAGFYFGARSVSAAQAAVRGGDDKGSIKVVGPTSPHPWGGGPVDVTLATTPSFVDVSTSIRGDPTGRVDRLGQGRYRYVPGAPEANVTIEFAIPEPYEASATLVLEPEAADPVPAVEESDDLETSPADGAGGDPAAGPDPVP